MLPNVARVRQRAHRNLTLAQREDLRSRGALTPAEMRQLSADIDAMRARVRARESTSSLSWLRNRLAQAGR